MVTIILLMISADSSRGGACSIHGRAMIQQTATAAGVFGELRWGSPRRLLTAIQWSTYKSVQRTAGKPAVADFYRSALKHT
jgi:hypothetical protein